MKYAKRRRRLEATAPIGYHYPTCAPGVCEGCDRAYARDRQLNRAKGQLAKKTA